MKRLKYSVIYFFLFGGLVILDQWTKSLAAQILKNSEDYILIPKILRFHYLENKGAAWGMLQGHTWLFVLITFLVFAFLIYMFTKLPLKKRFIPLQISFIILAAGAAGNFIDRVWQHYVIDFIYFEIINFPVFNVADIYVCVSAALLLYLLIFYYKEEELTWKKK